MAMPKRRDLKVVKGTTWAEDEGTSGKSSAQFDPMDGLNLTWKLSREWGLKNGIDVDAIQLRGSPVTLHRARRQVRRGRPGAARAKSRKTKPRKR